ncbi:MAG: TonB-dependent receptor [Alteromonadaceae bacterium]|jgi:TonB-dependent receptor
MTNFKTWPHFKHSAIALACSSLLLTSLAHAQNYPFSGRITDSANTVYFEGAQVKIKELGLAVVTTRDGRFVFNQVPEGEYTLEIHYLGAETVTKKIIVTASHSENNTDNNTVSKNEGKKYAIGGQYNALENVIVYGQRAGQANAINRQKNANNLKSIVSADTIGQSPDQNAAEALQRLPGMSIQRDQGEGRFVAIRGIDPNLNNVTINGVNVPSPESGARSVAMDVIPSELIQSLEVSKTVTPDMDASAIGGSIEVKSLSAFDRQGESYSATVQGSFNQQTQESSPKVSGSYTNIYALGSGAQLGVAGAVSWFERKFGSHNIETDGGWDDFTFEDAQTGDDVEIFAAEEIEQRAYLITRERLGAALNFDLHTSATDTYHLRTLYSRFSDDEFRLRNEYKFAKGAVDLSTVNDHSATFSDAKMDRDTKDRFEQQEILSIVAGGENQLQNWLIEYDFGYSKSKEAEPDRVDSTFVGKDLLLGYQSTGKTPQLTQSSAAHDLSNFVMDEISYENNLTEDEELSVKLDLSKNFVWNNYNGQLKFGAKHQARQKFNEVDVTIYDGGFDDVTAQNFANSTPDYTLGNFGPGLKRDQLKRFVLDNRSQFDENVQEALIDNKGKSYESDEKVTSAYFMMTLDLEQWQIVTGLRYENTRFETRGNRVELIVDDVNDDENVEISPWEVSKSYDHLLPSLNVKYNASEQLVARFAFTQTIARPNFGDAAAYQVIESEISEDDSVVVTERKAEVGNPDLKPFESDNFDLSLEYYPGDIGVLSLGVFHKNIDNYIVNAEVQDNGNWAGFKEVIQPINGGKASLTGAEIAWTKNFTSGIFVGVNGTFVDTDAKLPKQADTVGNVMLGFENNDFSVRLSASYKSDSYQFDDNNKSVYEATHSQLDFSGKYYINNTMQVYFNAVNLTDEPMYLYHGNETYNYQYEQYGASFELGFTMTSL